MHKGTLLIAVLLVAATAAASEAAPRQRAQVDPGLKAQQESNMFIRDALQPWTTREAPAARPRAAKKSRAKKS